MEPFCWNADDVCKDLHTTGQKGFDCTTAYQDRNKVKVTCCKKT